MINIKKLLKNKVIEWLFDIEDVVNQIICFVLMVALISMMVIGTIYPKEGMLNGNFEIFVWAFIMFVYLAAWVFLFFRLEGFVFIGGLIASLYLIFHNIILINIAIIMVMFFLILLGIAMAVKYKLIKS